MGGGKKGGGGESQTIRMEMDPAQRAYLNQYRKLAQQGFDRFATRGAGPGVGPLYEQLQQGYQNLGMPNEWMQQAGQYAGQAAGGLEQAGQTGLKGIGQYFNPYQNEVIGGMQSDFDRQRQQAAMRAQQVATQSGAFGGNRSAVLEAESARNLQELEGQQLGQFRHQGFQSAADQLMAERQRLGSLGMQGLQNLYNVGQFQSGMQQAGLQGLGGLMQYGRDVGMQQYNQPFQNYQQALGLFGPALGMGDSTQTTAQPTSGGGPFQGALGGAMTGFSMGGPIGGAIGGGLGLLGGMF